MENRNCPGCGAPLKPETFYCEFCSSDWTPSRPKAAPAPKTSRMAVGSFILSLYSFYIGANPSSGIAILIVPVVGSILGIRAIQIIHKRPDSVGGNMIALAGTIVNIAGLLLFIAVRIIEAKGYGTLSPSGGFVPTK